MKTEIEAKFININVEEIREKLKSIGGKLIQPEILMKRKIFDYTDGRFRKIGAWVRVRDEGNKITLSYKRLVDRTINGTSEIVVEVNDFDKTCDLLLAIGLDQKSYQETKRETWNLDNCEVTIDNWPWIPTLVEIEAEAEDMVRTAAEKLGLNWSKAMHGSVENAYQAVYDVSEEEIDNWKEIVFSKVPDWLEMKRKK